MRLTVLIVTDRNEVLAKVIFSQACVCPQGGCLFGGVPPNFRGVFFWGFLQISGGCLLGGVPSNFRGGVFFGGVPPNFRGGCLFLGGGVPPPEYGQRSAGTHPTGMHSYLV